MSEFLFDEGLHKYTLDGEVLPSVTQVMAPLHDFGWVNKDVLRRAGEFGTAVHKMVELYLKDDLDEDSLDPSLYGCLSAFKLWQSDEDFIFTGSENIEVIGYHPKLKYAGTPDIETETMIIDLKTRPVNMLNDAIQLAAYDNMTGRGNRERRVLELRQDGHYSFTKVNHRDAYSRFRLLLDHYRNTQIIKSWGK